jgi:hypothetical protein
VKIQTNSLSNCSQIIGASEFIRCLTNPLNCRQKHGQQNHNDGDNYKKLDQGETASVIGIHRMTPRGATMFSLTFFILRAIENPNLVLAVTETLTNTA